MDKKEILKERFKSAISSTVKVIADNSDLKVNFGKNIESKNDSLNLPEIKKLSTLQDYIDVRAYADSEALKIKYNDKKIFLKNEPKGEIAKTLYAIAEKIRYEVLGSNKLKGIRNNIITSYENKIKNKKNEDISNISNETIAEAFELYLRNHFFNLKQNNQTKKILDMWKDVFDNNLQKGVEKLNDNLNYQNKFNSLTAKLISELNFQETDLSENEDKKSEALNDSDPTKNDGEEK